MAEARCSNVAILRLDFHLTEGEQFPAMGTLVRQFCELFRQRSFHGRSLVEIAEVEHHEFGTLAVEIKSPVFLTELVKKVARGVAAELNIQFG